MVLYQRRITVADSEKSNDKDLRKATVNKDIAGRPIS
jgi:hypothetical protein